MNAKKVRNRFNELCRQFDNGCYASFQDYTIPKQEDIASRMETGEKEHAAVFYQITDPFVMQEKLAARYTPPQLTDPALDAEVNSYLKQLQEEALEQCHTRPVTLSIQRSDSRRYRIDIYYFGFRP